MHAHGQPAPGPPEGADDRPAEGRLGVDDLDQPDPAGLTGPEAEPGDVEAG